MSNTYITLVAAAPLRAEPSHRSEMVTQLLFGERCELMATSGDFGHVQCSYDGYAGWVQLSQVAAIETGLFDTALVVAAQGVSGVKVNGAPVALSPGAELFAKGTGRQQLDVHGWQASGNEATYDPQLWQKCQQAAQKDIKTDLLLQAHGYLGTPYMWGGKSIWGIDCSGLVQMSFKQCGMFLPRDAWQQAEGGDMVGFLQEVLPGDLAFFDNAEGRITHVGIMLNPQEILHASGVVRIDPIDNVGIIHRQTGKRTHQLRIIKRFF